VLDHEIGGAKQAADIGALDHDTDALAKHLRRETVGYDGDRRLWVLQDKAERLGGRVPVTRTRTYETAESKALSNRGLSSSQQLTGRHVVHEVVREPLIDQKAEGGDDYGRPQG
jgi:hypothetical protein